MEHKRYFDINAAEATNMCHEDGLIAIPNCNSEICKLVSDCLSPENPHLIHLFIVFDHSDYSDTDFPDVIDTNTPIDFIDKKIYVGVVVDTIILDDTNGCLIVKTLRGMSDSLTRKVKFDDVDFTIIVSRLSESPGFDNCSEEQLVLSIRIHDAKTSKCMKKGRKNFRFVTDEGTLFFM